MTNRRQFLKTTASGFGYLPLASLLAEQSRGANPLAAKTPHFKPRAKRVIFLFMEGGPSHVDLIDYKPQLVRLHDTSIPAAALPRKIREGKGESLDDFHELKGPIAKFRQRGESGLWISDLLPGISSLADELCILNGMICDSNEHGTATQQLHTGLPVLPRPSMGAWLLYGLGTENQNMPGFVVVSPPAGTNVHCGTDFLPGIYQSTILRDSEKPGSDKIRYLIDEQLPRDVRRRQLDFLQEINRQHAAQIGSEPGLESMMEANELAFRMQVEAPDVLDVQQESQATQKLYGIGETKTDGFGRQCLIARRLAQAGVRFIQVTNKGWDHHGEIDTGLPDKCRDVDQPIAGLLTDLKRHGLLNDTLVVWTGEFGRTPMGQRQGAAKNKPPGRGHNPFGWSLFMAGGGIKGGFVHGATDEFGYTSVQGRVHIHDLHATILHLLGLDHQRLTYRFGGRDYRLTDVYGHVVHEIIG